MSKFQLILGGIAGGLIFLAFLVFAGVLPGLSNGGLSSSASKLTMWGTFPAEYFSEILDQLNKENKGVFSLRYAEKSEDDVYERELIDALASGRGPDIWIMTQDFVLANKNKIYKIPFSAFNERLFKDTFLDISELYLDKDGIIAVPFSVDPIVLYFNKDLFAKAGLAKPPVYWDEFLNFSQDLTEKDSSGNIIQSGAALGEFSNVNHAKEIFSLLMLQTGNKIVDGYKLVMLEKSNFSPMEPATNALTFYTSFSNPSKVSYSWNRALPSSLDMFSFGKLAMYLGYAGEYGVIKNKNPHLNFDVSSVPQIKDYPVQATFGRLYGLAVSKSSANTYAAISAVFALADKNYSAAFSAESFLPPARRDLISRGASDTAMAVFYKAVVQARAWLEPDSAAVSDIFKKMIEAVATGQKLVSKAAADAKILLQAELKNIQNSLELNHQQF